jgi:hypothetical protein
VRAWLSAHLGALGEIYEAEQIVEKRYGRTGRHHGSG